MLDFNIPFLKSLILQGKHIKSDDRNLFLDVEKVEYRKGRISKGLNNENSN
jgi:hypothetical protein